MFTRLLKFFLFAFAVFGLLLVLAAGLTQTHSFKSWLRGKIEQQAGKLLNGKLHLGRIEGNLVSNIVFRDLCIELESDTLLYVATIEIGLTPFDLLKQQISINNLILQFPRLLLKQRPDSTWNLAHLFKPSDRNTAALWRITLQLQIENGTVTLVPLDTLHKPLPRRLQNLATSLQLEYADPRLHVMLHNLQLTSVNPPLQIDSLAAQVFLGGDSLRIKNFSLCSKNSRLNGQILLRHFTRPIFDVELYGAPLHLADLRSFFPSFPVTGPVHGMMHALGDVQNVRTTFSLAHADGRAEGNFFVCFDSTTTFYNLEAAVRALNLKPYLPPDQAMSRLNFDLELDGSGLTLDDLNARLSLNLDSSRVLGRDISQLRLTANAREKQLETKLSAISPAGELELSGKLIDPLGQQVFEFNAEARRFNLAKFLQNDTLDSDVTFRLAASGQHFDNARRKLDGWLRLSPSRLPAILLDYAYCQFHIRGTDLQLDTLYVDSSIGVIQAGGVLSLHYTNNFRFRAELGDLAWIKNAIEADTLRAAGVFSGSAIGPIDSLAVFSRFDLKKVRYNRTTMEQLTGTLSFHRAGENGGGFIRLRAGDMMMGFVPVDSTVASVYYDLTRAQILANFWQGKENTGVLEGIYTYGEIGRFDVVRGEFNLFGQIWRTPPDQDMWVDVSDEDFYFHKCLLTYKNQRVYIDGRLSYDGEENLHFKIEDVDIAAMIALARNGSSPNGVTGVLDGELFLTGSAESPILRGSLTWNQGRVADFVFEKWEADFDYENEFLSWKFQLYQNQNRSLTGDGYLPMNLSFNNNGKILYHDRPMRIQAGTAGIDLAFLQTLTDRVKQVQGTLVFDIKLENTLARPHSRGVVRIVDGAFSAPEFNVVYNDVQMAVSIDTTAVKLIDLRIQNDKGVLRIDGQLNRTQNQITDANASLTAKDFLLVRNRDMELRLDANIKGSGDAQGPRYRGDLTILRSRFFLPAFQQRTVIELSEAKTETTSPDSVRLAVASSNDKAPEQRWLQKLRGELKINIPRNTWLRGPELNAEISGALDFVQEGTAKFSLFGTLNIIRGTYELYGKKFDIDNGRINFEGDLHKPQFELTAKHVFRAAIADREKRNLEVTISGELSNPKIEFRENGATLDEKDALANLIFGVNFDQLLYDQRRGLESQTGNEASVLSTAAMGLISGLVSQELAKSIGRSLDLDLIEFQSGEDITKSSVLVGKYLTDNLFLSFGQEPEGRVVALEWELLKFLFLQAAHGGEENRKTGFDLIWKLDW
ncbi:MAG: translocation/assembly module TamB domain-containing protein [candidate division KSB1 bacterium]|nr:translocation/assembly module TamB domain-containing protein [candidate division KSB1 bacterium]MDZ7366981.1 translocation/assembly module TamB domain-containing protein [candidate division KSB1 bacterium]MDZ7406814.1 translocation/assembly module TamB domain-containing protein [candidate division KSB1 bacterium]